MRQAGLNCVEIAQKNGSWTLLDDVEALTIPNDLAIRFENDPISENFFHGLSVTVRKNILVRLVLAKKEETREKRLNEIHDSLSQKLIPKQF